jgi:hypothetical protein
VTVFSEPPELEVFLDGSKVGQTPLWLERVSQGFHKLRVKDVETEIHLEAGKGLRVGLFKGDLVLGFAFCSEKSGQKGPFFGV